MAPPSENFLRTFGDWYMTGRNSDLTLVTADGGEFRVHDMVIDIRCPRVKALATRTDGGHMQLDERRDVLQMLLCWAYDIEWPDMAGMSVGEGLILLGEVGRASDTYDIDELNEATVEKMNGFAQSKLTTLNATLNFLLGCTWSEWNGMGMRVAVLQAQAQAQAQAQTQQRSQQGPAVSQNHDGNEALLEGQRDEGERNDAAEVAAVALRTGNEHSVPSLSSGASREARRRALEKYLGSSSGESVSVEDKADAADGTGAANVFRNQLKQEEDAADQLERAAGGQEQYSDIIRVPLAPKRKVIPSTKAKEAASTKKKAKAAPPTKKRKARIHVLHQVEKAYRCRWPA